MQPDGAEDARTRPTTLWAAGAKRVFDMVAAGVLLLACLPLLGLAALLIRLEGRGPIFFLQDRIGREGRRFQPFKLRTMRAGRAPDARELVPLDHPEITRVGRFLRRFKIDELPQLWNVLIGDMSLVGPRPTLPDQVEAYDAFRRQRLLVRPGMTGLAQIHGNTAISWDERILYDIAYVRACSLRLDAIILLRTLGVVFRGDTRAARRFAESAYAGLVTVPPGYFGDG